MNKGGFESTLEGPTHWQSGSSSVRTNTKRLQGLGFGL
jgi:hypothetical protein